MEARMIMKLRTYELEWKQIDDEIVALDGRRAEYLAVEGSGVALWQTLHAGASREQLIGLLVSRYRIAPERAGADVDAFIAELTAKDLLAA